MTTSPFVASLGMGITLLLLALLIVFELLPEEHRSQVRGFFFGAIIVFLAAFIFIIMHRLEGIV